MKYLPKLSALSLSGGGIGDGGAKAVASALKHVPQLELLDLSKNALTKRGAAAVGSALVHVPHLKKLYIVRGNAKVGKIGKRHLADGKNAVMKRTADTMLAEMREVLSLEQSGDSLSALMGTDAEPPRRTEKLLHAMMDIKYLKQRYGGVEFARSVSDALKLVPKLTEIIIERRSLGDEGAEIIANALEGVGPSLKTIIFTSNGMQNRGAYAVARALKGRETLHILCVREKLVLTEGAMAIAEVLADLTTLSRLELFYMRLGDAGAGAIAAQFKNIPSLEHLRIVDAGIKSAGVAALARGMRDLTILQSLNLDGNSVSGDGLSDLVDLIIDTTGASSPQFLSLANNGIGDEGASHVGRLLEMHDLQHIDLGYNHIGSAGAEALAKGFKYQHELAVVRLDGNEITNAGAFALAPSFAEMDGLFEVILCKNPIKRSGVQALKKSTSAFTGMRACKPARPQQSYVEKREPKKKKKKKS